MAKQFEYEWWTVDITYATGKLSTIWKGKNRDNVVKQIMKEFMESNSEENAMKPVYLRKDRIDSIHWDTMKLDHVGYNRCF